MSRHYAPPVVKACLVMMSCLVVALTACSPSTSQQPTTGISLPSNVRDSHVLKVATNYEWPPFSFQDASGNVVGLDIDLMNAIAHELGVKAEFTNLSFDVMIPSVVNGRFDIAAEGLSDTAKRRDVVTFVDYASSGIGVMVRKNYTGGLTPTNLCGHIVSVTQGSSVATLVPQISDACVKNGKPAIQIQLYSDNAPGILAVVNGRAEAYLADVAVGTYLTQTSNPTLAVLPGFVPGSQRPTGLAIAKGNTTLVTAVQQAMNKLIANGTYLQLLKKWGLERETIPTATINGA